MKAAFSEVGVIISRMRIKGMVWIVGKTFKHMDLQQRLKLKEMLDSGCSILEVANALGVHRSAVYREIERGGMEGGYDPYYAQSLYEGRLKKKGRPECKLSNKDLAEYISGLILEEHLSPEKIVDLLAEDDRGFPDVPQSPNTIYNAIDKGLIPNVTRESLLSKSCTVFSGGQICIPKWVLDKLEIKDGDMLQLEITENGEMIYRKAGK